MLTPAMVWLGNRSHFCYFAFDRTQESEATYFARAKLAKDRTP
jgi:hypothetical protein